MLGKGYADTVGGLKFPIPLAKLEVLASAGLLAPALEGDG
jgi:hypothetical protein